MKNRSDLDENTKLKAEMRCLNKLDFNGQSFSHSSFESEFGENFCELKG